MTYMMTSLHEEYKVINWICYPSHNACDHTTHHICYEWKSMMHMVGLGGPVCLIAFDLRFNFERENWLPYETCASTSLLVKLSSALLRNLYVLCSDSRYEYNALVTKHKLLAPQDYHITIFFRSCNSVQLGLLNKLRRWSCDESHWSCITEFLPIFSTHHMYFQVIDGLPSCSSLKYIIP